DVVRAPAAWWIALFIARDVAVATDRAARRIAAVGTAFTLFPWIDDTIAAERAYAICSAMAGRAIQSLALIALLAHCRLRNAVAAVLGDAIVAAAVLQGQVAVVTLFTRSIDCAVAACRPRRTSDSGDRRPRILLARKLAHDAVCRGTDAGVD